MLVVEDGTGLVSANSVITTAFVTQYLKARNRESENNWSTLSVAAQEAACIAATDYMDARFGLNLKGIREFRNIEQANATGQLTVISGNNFANGETVVIGGVSYQMVSNITGQDMVLIGSDANDTLTNLADAINAGTGSGTLFSSNIVQNPSVSASVVGNVMTVTARSAGSQGNDITTTETAAQASWAHGVLIGGADQNDVQGTEFPRLGLVTRDGQQVKGVPLPWKQAAAEYAVRSVAANLEPDPGANTNGVRSTRRRAGSVETETVYENGDVLSRIKAYPAVDRLVAQYLTPSGVSR